MLSSLTVNQDRLFPQMLMHATTASGTVQLIGNDSAVLDADEARKDLPCAVTPIKPVRGFDLRFPAGYEIAVPLHELAGEGDLLTIIFRVSPSNDKDSAVFFSQKYMVPSIEPEVKGDAYLAGGFDVGEGSYRVDWMMRDRIERVCSSGWDVTAALSSRDQNVKLAIPPNA